MSKEAEKKQQFFEFLKTQFLCHSRNDLLLKEIAECLPYTRSKKEVTDFARACIYFHECLTTYTPSEFFGHILYVPRKEGPAVMNIASDIGKICGQYPNSVKNFLEWQFSSLPECWSFNLGPKYDTLVATRNDLPKVEDPATTDEQYVELFAKEPWKTIAENWVRSALYGTKRMHVPPEFVGDEPLMAVYENMRDIADFSGYSNKERNKANLERFKWIIEEVFPNVPYTVVQSVMNVFVKNMSLSGDPLSLYTFYKLGGTLAVISHPSFFDAKAQVLRTMFQGYRSCTIRLDEGFHWITSKVDHPSLSAAFTHDLHQVSGLPVAPSEVDVNSYYEHQELRVSWTLPKLKMAPDFSEPAEAPWEKQVLEQLCTRGASGYFRIEIPPVENGIQSRKILETIQLQMNRVDRKSAFRFKYYVTVSRTSPGSIIVIDEK